VECPRELGGQRSAFLRKAMENELLPLVRKSIHVVTVGGYRVRVGAIMHNRAVFATPPFSKSPRSPNSRDPGVRPAPLWEANRVVANQAKFVISGKANQPAPLERGPPDWPPRLPNQRRPVEQASNSGHGWMAQ
jgi:hypothetical protein